MYYTNGNYAAFSKARKPVGVEDRKAYIVGGGLAGLSTAVFLVRDGQMPGENITVLEELKLPVGVWTGSRIKSWDISSAAGARWKTILNACGICIAPFRH